MASPSNPPGCKLAFDVTNLDATCAFYKRLGDFDVVATSRAGQILESRELASPHYPGVRLHARLSFGKRAAGTSPGGITTFGLPTSDMAGAIRRLAGTAKWVSPNPEATPDEPRASIVVLDPDAYQIELYRP